MVVVLGLVDDSCAAGNTAVVVDEDVAHDCEHPSFEVGVVGIFVGVGENLEGRVLQEVISVVAVGGEHVCEVEHVVLEAHEAVLERG